MQTKNKPIDDDIKKLQDVYFLDTVLSKSKTKGKVGYGADNVRNPVPHEKQEVDQDPVEEPDKKPEEYGIINVDVLWRSDLRKRPVA